MTLRRHFDLLPEDSEFLNDYGLPWESLAEGSQWVLIHEFPTHPGYNHRQVIAAIRIETGYPKTPLDMVYFYPALSRVDGKGIGATQAVQQIDGKAFQRWSRHRTSDNPWKIDQDNIGTHIVLIEDWLERELAK